MDTMSTTKNTEAQDVVGRHEAENEMPAQMRGDVRLLGELLGQVLRESDSPGLFEDVERLRAATIEAYTDTSQEAFERAMEVAQSFSIERSTEVARAFTVYFHLVNLAEEHHRVRTLRERDNQENPAKKPNATAEAYADLAAEIGADAARKRLDGLRFHPVFTAHPTEARRRAISSAIRRVGGIFEEYEAVEPKSSEGRRLKGQLIEEIDTMWRTAPLREEKPKPEAEVRAIMSVFDKTLFEAAGLDPETPPLTLEEVGAAAEKLSKKNGGPAEFGFNAAVYGWFVEQEVASNGDVYCSPDNGRGEDRATEFSFDNEGAVEFLASQLITGLLAVGGGSGRPTGYGLGRGPFDRGSHCHHGGG